MPHYNENLFIYIYKKQMTEGFSLKGNVYDRSVILGRYITEHGATVRDAAAEFNISKSTVHKDVTERLRGCDPELCAQVREVLEKNKAERHMRGGEATKHKYAEINANKKIRRKKYVG